MLRTVAQALAVLVTASMCAARDLYVGGRDGWTTNPGEPHNQWAEHNRFQVSDTLVFRYNKDVDGVLRVTQSHYDACNTSEPILRLHGGDSRFVFPVSGPYFFISADAGRCKAGERLIVVVLAVRSPPLLPSPPPKSAPKPASSSSAAPQTAPKQSSSSSAPPPPTPPVPTPAPPPPTPPAGNVSSPSPAPSKSSAVALRAVGALACLIVGGAAIV